MTIKNAKPKTPFRVFRDAFIANLPEHTRDVTRRYLNKHVDAVNHGKTEEDKWHLWGKLCCVYPSDMRPTRYQFLKAHESARLALCNFYDAC